MITPPLFTPEDVAHVRALADDSHDGGFGTMSRAEHSRWHDLADRLQQYLDQQALPVHASRYERSFFSHERPPAPSDPPQQSS